MIRAELDFKRSLVSGDQFHILTQARRQSKFKFSFLQDIIRTKDQQLMLQAKITVASVTATGKPMLWQQSDSLLTQ